MRLVLTLAFTLVCIFPLFGQDDFDRSAAYDVVELNELMLVYSRTSVEKLKPTRYADCVDHNVALQSAGFDSRTRDLINWSMGHPVRLQLVQSSLRALANDNFYWAIAWDLVPQEGASTGIPYRLRNHLNGNGKPIIPQLYFRATCQIAETTFVHCTLPVKDCARCKVSERLAGEEILKLARAELSRYTAGELRDMIKSLEGVDEPRWILHRLALVEDLPDELSLWRVEFRDSQNPGARSITVWVSESGTAGTLTCGQRRLEVPELIE